MQSKILSICTNMAVQRASDAAGFHSLLHLDKANKRVQASRLLVERTVPKTNNLSAATKNRTPHFQHFIKFC
ncbi:MAG: hypothetical protein LBB21_07310 [Holosporaceae bacterium]|jgi:hypothetical protein|nr:hypothetical protein [Holosporaceae bacterium]